MPISFETARDIILENVTPLQPEKVSLLEVVGRVLAEDIYASWDMPRWDNSAMDGFAVRVEDCVQGRELLIDGYLPAGASAEGLEIPPGTAIRIMTGAPAPKGCSAIIPIEDTEVKNDKIIICNKVKNGDHLRIRGEDVQQGTLIITAGTVLRPAEINMLASFGYHSVSVFKRPKVAILATGDELVEPEQKPGPGQIINSNDYSIAAAIQEVGGEPVRLGIARDDKDSLVEKIKEGLKADALITTAGVSLGDRDLVREVLEELGVKNKFWKIDIKPGRPTAFGLKDDKPVFSLPGNPVSSMVTFEEFVRPALLKMMGHKKTTKPYIKAILQEQIKKKVGRTQFLRVTLTKDGERIIASSAGDQNTGILSTMLQANGIAVLPADQDKISSGENVDVHIISSDAFIL